MLARAKLVLDLLPARLKGRVTLVIKDHTGRRHIVEQAGQSVMEKRQPMLHALMFATRGDRLIKWIILARAAKFNAVILPKPRDRRLR